MIHPGAVDGLQDLPETPRKYWVPEDCAQLYRIVQTGFNQLYAGYGANLASVAGDDGEAACAARGMEAMLSRSDPVIGNADGTTTGERRSSVSAWEWVESYFGEEADCDSGGDGVTVGDDGSVAPSESVDTSILTARGNQVAMARSQASIVSGNDSADDSSVLEAAGEKILGKLQAITSELAALWEYLDARRTVPLLVGLCALGYGLVIMACPFLFAFAVLPGQSRLLFGPLRLLLYIHVLLFGLYFVLRVAGWATGELVMLVSSTPDVRMMLDSPYMSMLAVLPLLIHIVVGVMVYVSWKIVWGGEEKGLMGGRGAQTLNKDNQRMGAGVAVGAMAAPTRAARVTGIARGGTPGGGGRNTQPPATTPSSGPGSTQAAKGNTGSRAWPATQTKAQGGDGPSTASPSGEGQEPGSGAQQHAGGWTAAGVRSQLGKGRDTGNKGPSRSSG